MPIRSRRRPDRCRCGWSSSPSPCSTRTPSRSYASTPCTCTIAGGQSHWDCFFHVDDGLTAAGDLLKNASEDNRRSFFAHGRALMDDYRTVCTGPLPRAQRPVRSPAAKSARTARPARTAQGQAVPHRTAPNRTKPPSRTRSTWSEPCLPARGRSSARSWRRTCTRRCWRCSDRCWS